MRLYRICHARHLEDLRGLGAGYRDGARWYEPGYPIVYFAESCAPRSIPAWAGEPRHGVILLSG